MPPVQVLRPEGAHEQYVEPGGDRKALEQPQAVGVGPMEVLEDDYRRGSAGKVPHELGGRPQQLVGCVGTFLSLKARRHGSEQRPEGVPPRRKAVGDLLPGGHVCADRFQQQGERASHCALLGSRCEGSRRGRQVAQQLLHEAGLARPGLSADEGHPRVATGRCKLSQPDELRGPSDHDWG